MDPTATVGYWNIQYSFIFYHFTGQGWLELAICRLHLCKWKSSQLSKKMTLHCNWVGQEEVKHVQLILIMIEVHINQPKVFLFMKNPHL